MTADTSQAVRAAPAAAVPSSTGSGEEFRDDVRKKLPPEVIAKLTALSPWRSTLAIAGNVAILAAAIAVALVWRNPLLTAAMVVVIGTQQHGLFILAHDAAHYRLYANRSLNDFMGRLIGAVVGISMCTYRVIHRLHHNHLYQAQDPDTAIHGGYPRGRAYLVRKLMKDLTGVTAYKNYAYFFGAPALNTETHVAQRPLDDTSERLRAEARADRRSVIIVQLAMPALAFAGGFGVEYLLLWVLPLLTVIQVILRLRAICEHGAVTDLSSPLTAARTNLAPWTVRWLLFQHSVNYHVEHHLYPGVPHYRLRALHEELAARGILKGAEICRLSDTLRRVFAERRPGQTPAPA
jgi:fatty acid desaturase